MISICSRPRKPQRKPKPSASDVSGSKEKEESFSFSLASASRSCSYCTVSIGYRPEKTIGLTSLKPSSAFSHWRCRRVTVSPTLASATSLMPAMMKPTSPAASSGTSLIVGANTPTLSASNELLVDISWILSPFLSVPSKMRTRMMTP